MSFIVGMAVKAIDKAWINCFQDIPEGVGCRVWQAGQTGQRFRHECAQSLCSLALLLICSLERCNERQKRLLKSPSVHHRQEVSLPSLSAVTMTAIAVKDTC